MTTVVLVMYYGTKMVRVGDAFHHDSSCSAQTKFNSTGGYTYTWLCVHKCFIIVITYITACH